MVSRRHWHGENYDRRFTGCILLGAVVSLFNIIKGYVIYILVNVFHISGILVASVMMADIDHLLLNHTASHRRGPQSSHTNSHRHSYLNAEIKRDKDQCTAGLYPQTLDILNENFLCEPYKFTTLLSKSRD